MSNVVLFWQEAGYAPPTPRSETALAVDAVLTCSLRSGLAAADLGARLDAIDPLVDMLDDPDVRRSLRRMLTSHREELIHSILELDARIAALTRR
jgi:hypothetical protein